MLSLRLVELSMGDIRGELIRVGVHFHRHLYCGFILVDLIYTVMSAWTNIRASIRSAIHVTGHLEKVCTVSVVCEDLYPDICMVEGRSGVRAWRPIVSHVFLLSRVVAAESEKG